MKPVTPGGLSPSKDPGRWVHLESILDRALEQDPRGWPALLDSACAGDPLLRAEAEELLDRLRDGAIAGFLEGPPVTALEPPCERTIGPWRIDRELARGGMGQVFLARRADGRFDLEVAVKLLHPLLVGPDVRRRFDRERRILASLAHPGIARLLDAGETSEGRPYLVTELVEGHPLGRHLSLACPPAALRLDLFRQVASAVGHAHRSLLVHGDLKPSNILVSQDGRTKLVDFGIAGRVGTSQGESGSWLTPEWASPEQRRGEDVTTGTDIYQLGLLLRTLFEGAATAPGALPPPVAEDLEWIVRRATAHEPTSRYTSVDALLADVEHAFANLPVKARPATRRDRIARLLRRRRIEAMAAAAAVAALSFGTFTVAWQASVASTERDEARAAQSRADDARIRAEGLTEILIDLFTAADPWQGSIRDPAAARALLAVGHAHLGRMGETIGEAPVQLADAELIQLLGRIHLRLDEADAAEALASRILQGTSPDDPARATGLVLQALVERHRGMYARSETLLEEALAIERAHFGPDEPAVAATLHLLATRSSREDLGRAEALHREALAIRRAALGPGHPLSIWSLRAVGRALRAQGLAREAAATLSEALALARANLGPDHPEVAEAMLNLADVLLDHTGDTLGADALYRGAVDLQRQVLGSDFPGLTHGLERLATIRAARGDAEGAERLLREALGLRERAFGPDHPAVALGLGRLAAEFHRQGRLGESEAFRRDELRILEASRGADHWDVTGAMGELALLRADRGALAEARELLETALGRRLRTRGAHHGAVAEMRSEFGRVLCLEGEERAATEAMVEALAVLQLERTADHPSVILVGTWLDAIEVHGCPLPEGIHVVRR